MNAVGANFATSFAANHCRKIELGHTSRYIVGIVRRWPTRRHLDSLGGRNNQREAIVVNRWPELGQLTSTIRRSAPASLTVTSSFVTTALDRLNTDSTVPTRTKFQWKISSERLVSFSAAALCAQSSIFSCAAVGLGWAAHCLGLSCARSHSREPATDPKRGGDVSLSLIRMVASENARQTHRNVHNGTHIDAKRDYEI